uniref:ferroxidase n=1 Tax=Anabas testudineus TaxID=64144 RepID=A0AAQ6IDG4_ANATE
MTNSNTASHYRGLLGPTLRAEEGEMIVVTFRNMATGPHSIHPHGVAYGKQSEGESLLTQLQQPSTPNTEHVYYWEVTSDVSPQSGDPTCLTYTYVSHQDVVRDYNSGLIGTLLICKTGSLDDSGKQIDAHQEYVFLFGIFDERVSKYKPNSQAPDNHVKYTINGYTSGSLPDVTICAHTSVSLHLVGMSSEPEVFSVHMNGHVLQQTGHKVSSVGLISGSSATANMTAFYPGRWMLSSRTFKHIEGKSLTIEQKRQSREWKYYIAAEEIVWDYAPQIQKHVDEDFKHLYLKQSPTRIGPKYKKAVYYLYNNESFTERLEDKHKKSGRGLLGPVIRAQVRDVVTIVFKNMASRPYSIYPHGLTIDKSAEGVNYPEGGNQSHGVLPGETRTYVWRVAEEDEPLEGDARCVTRMYHSAVDTPRDIASGLIGPLLICRSQSLNVRNVQLRADKEQHAMFAVFDENKSWYLDYNIRQYCDRSKVNKADLDFYKSNVMHTINGYAFESGPVLGFCNGEVATWHVSSVGAQDYIQTATFYGHPFMLNERTEDFLSLYPMTGETITMKMDNIGQWRITIPLFKSHPIVLPSIETNKIYSVLELDSILVEDSKEKLTRGDVFSYSVPLHGAPEHNVSVLTVSQREDENKTATNHINRSADATNHLLSIQTADVGDVNINNTDSYNLTAFKLTDNKTNVNGSLRIVPELQYELQMNSSEVLINSANSSLENVTDPETETQSLQNVTVNTYTSNSSEEISSESRENISASQSRFNHTSSIATSSNETRASGSLSLSKSAVKIYTSEDLGASDSSSSEEVFVYLKESNTQVIQTTSVKTQGHNWTYDGTHQMVPLDIPDHRKYFENETPQKEPAPKKKKTVILRQRPLKGQSMKTKKKKQYQPQARSGLPFSPRGFNPGMTPRGTRPNVPQPVSDEQQLINSPVVIGLPRADFSDYEMYIPGEQPRHIELGGQDVTADEYEYVTYIDPYSGHDENKNLNLDETIKYFLKYSGPNVKTYFIAAEEVEWDYAEKSDQSMREMTTFTKVVFRGYMDSSFSTPDVRGELDEHLGILGPVIKAEVGQSIIVVFRNNANRPYSIHPNGVSYTKQSEGLSYDDGSQSWYEYDNEVQPNTTFTYSWKVSSSVGPLQDESNCRTWAYYSGVNPERDIHSGLIGPLLVCREGTLDRNVLDTREFVLLFMTFDESQSWYYEKNSELIQRKNRRRAMNPSFEEKLKFHSINGIIYNLKGLRMYTNQLVCWHLINMGSPRDFHSVHFHGQTFLHKKATSYRHAVYPLLPGSFATLEMRPTKPGLWQLETEVGFNQQNGMQTLFLVLNNDCYHPLGMESGSVKDEQITAINTRGYWGPHLARLNNQGQFNAWSTEVNNSWIQVDFQRPVVISQVATQGARQLFQTQFVDRYSISYSTDRRKWIFYKGDSRGLRKVSEENSDTKRNTFFPPLIGRFIRLHPINWYNKATVRMEFYGCELDGCSVPLGMESGLIEDHHITASSTASSWYGGPWKPSFARLNRQGTINAWQAKYNDMYQWLQVELPQVKKITGIVTQGAKALRKEMYVMSYSLQYSDNGIHWNHYTDDENVTFKVSCSKITDHVKNYIYPPIFSRFIRIIPRTWWVSLTMRIELLGCDFE